MFDELRALVGIEKASMFIERFGGTEFTFSKSGKYYEATVQLLGKDAAAKIASCFCGCPIYIAKNTRQKLKERNVGLLKMLETETVNNVALHYGLSARQVRVIARKARQCERI